MDRAALAAEYFVQGYNCAQAVAVAFADLIGMEEKTVARMVSGFGGGFGRLREVCGAVSGMTFVASCLYGYDDAEAGAEKKDVYHMIQELAGQFKEATGSIVCRDILKNPPSDPVPCARTEEYYATRPCVRMVYTAASIVDNYITAHPIEN